MELIPLAVALQGIGYGTYLTALQGLWAQTVLPELPTIGGYMAKLPLRTMPRRRILRGRHWMSPMWEPPAPLQAPLEDEDFAREDDEEALALACLL